MPRSFAGNKFPLIVSTILLLPPALVAQTPQRETGIPDGGTREILVSIFIPSLPDATFTATVNTEWIKALPDGTQITLKNHRLIARDKTGRIFQERRLLIPEDSKQDSVVTRTEISDPAAHAEYICVLREQVCHLEQFEPTPAGQRPTGNKAPKSTGGAEAEFLGTQSIAGLETEGTRETVVIPTGMVGNDSPIMTRREYWFSKLLGMNLLSIREDPRFGTQKFELSNIVVGEPDPKLFVVPEGSKVLDLRRPTGATPEPQSNR